MTNYKKKIQKLENRVAQELELDEVKVSHRYNSLFEYFRNEKELNKNIRKKLHEYAIFLHLLSAWVDPSELDSEEKIVYTPSRGRGFQLSRVPSLFVEPHLPPYPEDELWSQYRSEYNFLHDPGGEGPTHHTKPDVLLTTKNVDKLPWTANISPRPVDQSRLMRMASRSQTEMIAKELGIDVQEIPDSYAEVISLIQTEAKQESPSELYENWAEFQHNAERIIECKHGPLDESDFSQILWYGLAYKTDIMIISSCSVSDRQFTDDISNLPVEVKIISGIDVHTEFDAVRTKIERLL